MQVELKGIGVSPGIAIGPAATFGTRNLNIPKYTVDHADEELQRLDRAIAAARTDIESLKETFTASTGQREAAIFDAHLMILQDVTLMQEAEERIRSELINAEHVIDGLIKRYTEVMQSLEDPTFRDRTRDVVDVGERILRKLLNEEASPLDHLDRPSIIVAHDLSPSETAKLDVANTLGLATDVGGPTSHTAIIARALQIPAVLGLKIAGGFTLPGNTIVIDGTQGRVIVRPTEATLAIYRERQQRDRKERSALLKRESGKTAITKDGVSIPTQANIELPFEVAHCKKVGAEGIGLYRTEYLFLNRDTLPTEDEQYEAYRYVVREMRPGPVVLRTLDIGGDKVASHLHGEEEANPQLGWRAIRFCLERTDIFETQLRAMLRASMHGKVAIMFPLISGLEELRRAKAVLDTAKASLDAQQIAYDRDVKVGVMIEVPSAVTTADLLAEEADFFSIGTNDLIQYALAVDRANEKVAHQYEPTHPAVLRMIAQTADAARKAKIPVSVCGEMAGSPAFTELLLGLGITSLSMSSASVPYVRAEVAMTRLSTARRFAKVLLTLRTVTEVKEKVRRRFKHRQDMFGFLSQFDRHSFEEGNGNALGERPE